MTRAPILVGLTAAFVLSVGTGTSCSGRLPGLDGGSVGGGAVGGGVVAGGQAGGFTGGGNVAGGGFGAGCTVAPPQVAGCPCTGGGAIALSDRFVLARHTGDGGAITISNMFGREPVLPMLSGVPVSIAGEQAGVIVAVKCDSTPAQLWSGNLDGPFGVVCDPARALPSVTQGLGAARMVGGELWFAKQPGNVVRAFNDFAEFATFSAPGQTLSRLTYDAPSDRLFACELDAGTVWVWRNARQRRDGGVPDFGLQADGVRALDTADGRLYVATSGASSELRVWNGLATLDTVRPHDFALSFDGGVVSHLAASSGRLAVTLQTATTGRVLLYDSVTPDAGPTVVIDSPVLRGAFKSILSAPLGTPPSPRLYVMTPGGVAVFERPLVNSTSFAIRDAGPGGAIDMLFFE